MRKVTLALLFAFVATIVTVNAQTASPIKYDTTALKVYVGSYNIAAAGQRSKIVIKDGKLISMGGEKDYELVATSKEHVFEIGNGSLVVTFLVDDKKAVAKARVKTNDGQEFEAVKEK